MRFSIAIALCIFAHVTWAQERAAQPAVGEAAPAIELESLLQAPEGSEATWESLRNKVVVLEFWATWCGPCVGAISHMNELAEAFKDRPVQFLAITDEEEPTIRGFLEKKPIQGWVGLNTNSSMFKAYGVEGIPHTVIVGKDGKIAGVTDPLTLEAKHLENLLAGKEAGLPIDTDDGKLPLTARADEQSLVQITLRPSAGIYSWTSGNTDRNELGLVYESKALGIELPKLLRSLYGVPVSRFVLEATLPQGNFDFIVRLPAAARKELAEVPKQVVEATLGLSARREMRELDVYLLSVNDAGKKGLQPTATPKAHSISFGPGEVRGVNMTIQDFVSGFLDHQMGKPVINETNLPGGYDIEMRWTGEGVPLPGPKLMAELVRDQLGLELTPAKRPVEVVVVSGKEGE